VDCSFVRKLPSSRGSQTSAPCPRPSELQWHAPHVASVRFGYVVPVRDRGCESDAQPALQCQKAPTGADCLRCQKMNIKCEYIPLNVQRGQEGQHREQDETPRGPSYPLYPHQLGLDPSSPSGSSPRSPLTQHVYPGETPRSSRSTSSHAAGLIGPAEVAPRYDYPASHVSSGTQWAQPMSPSSRPAAGHELSPTIAVPTPQWSGSTDPQRQHITPLPPPGRLAQPDPRFTYSRPHGSSPETVTLPRLQTNVSANDYRRAYTPAPASAQSVASQWPARSATPGAPATHGHGRSQSSWTHAQQAQWSPATSSPASAISPSSYYTQQQSQLWQQQSVIILVSILRIVDTSGRYDPASSASGPGQPGSHVTMYADPRSSTADQWQHHDVSSGLPEAKGGS
jgi:hypothetical protein